MTLLRAPGELIRHASLANGRGRRLGVAVAGLAGHQVAEALVPVLIGVVIDRAIGRADLPALFRWLGVLAAVFALLVLAWRIATRLNSGVFLYGEHDLRLLAARRILHPRGMAGRRAPGETLTISTSDAASVSGFSWVIAEQSASFAALATATVSMLVISWPLAVCVVIATALQLLLIHRLSRPLEQRAYAEAAQAARASVLATDFAAGLRVLKGFGAEREAAARHAEAAEASRRAAVANVNAQARVSAVNTVVAGVFLALIALAASWAAASGAITVGSLVAVVGLAQFVRGPMEQLGYLGADLAAKRGSARRLSELLATPYQAPEAETEAAEPDPAAPVVVLGELRVRQGEIVGVDASEDATLLDLLSCRRAAPPGHYLVHGVDARRLGPDRVREVVFAPPHDATVFTGSVADNLAADAVQPWAVAASALDDVLTHLPDGLGSSVGEQGRLLSGGQRQRLLLARALHQPQPVLVLHEPTSSVDSVTEQRIARALRDVEGKTIILITSSPGLLRACSRVVRSPGREPR